MSQETVAVVRTFYEAWNANDMDAVRELYDSEAVVRSPDGWPEQAPLMGREAVMRAFERLRSTWDADTLEPISEFSDVGDRVAVRTSWRGAGRGPESSVETTPIYTIREGRIFYLEYFWDHGEALKAIGASE